MTLLEDSCMQHSRIIRELSKFVVIILIIAIVEQWATAYMVAPSYGLYFNHDINKIEKENKNVDMIFVGASRVYRTFAPYIFEEKLGLENVVNAGTSSQDVDGTYYMTKDMVDRLEPKYVVIGVTFEMLSQKERGDIESNLLVWDRLNAKDKLQMATTGFRLKDILYWLNLYRFREEDPDWWETYHELYEDIKSDNVVIKHDGSEDEYYCDKGFVYQNRSCGRGSFKAEKIDYSIDDNEEYCINYLDKIVDYCQNRGITVIFVTGVTSVSRMLSNSGYQEATNFYNQYCNEKGIKYYNLNLLKDREENLPEEKMFDDNHVNGEGAEIVSKEFAEILAIDFFGNDGNVNDYFFNTVEEFRSTVNRVAACGADICLDGDYVGIDTYSVYGTNIKGVEYRIVGINAEGVEQIVSDFSDNEHYRIPREEIDQIKIEAKPIGADNAEAYAIYTISNEE